jgi:hypothetical protein
VPEEMRKILKEEQLDLSMRACQVLDTFGERIKVTKVVRQAEGLTSIRRRKPAPPSLYEAIATPTLVQSALPSNSVGALQTGSQLPVHTAQRG